jgi:N-glycosylase/DNA lyase
MNAPSPQVLEAVVLKLCPVIEGRLDLATRRAVAERDLIYELVCCVLSSRVPFELARAATDRMDQWLLLEMDLWKAPNPSLREQMLDILMAPLQIGDKERRYRFPHVRAKQLEETRQALIRVNGGLPALIDNSIEDLEARRRLVREVSGFGPKQASMFLRNVGRSYDLAILDSHVMRFGCAIGVLSGQAPTSLSRYEELERSFRHYANATGYSVGCVDSAVWITMQAAKAIR